MLWERNTSVSLGLHYETFIEDRVAKGRYQNTSEVIRAGLRLLEEEEKPFCIAEQCDPGRS